MLVLTRRREEEVTVTVDGVGTMTIRILDIIGGVAKLGFEAPQEFRILRDNAKRSEPKDTRSTQDGDEEEGNGNR